MILNPINIPTFFHPVKEGFQNAWSQQALGLWFWQSVYSNHLCDHSPDFQLILEGRINFLRCHSQPDTCAAACATACVLSGVQFALTQRQKISFCKYCPGFERPTALSPLEKIWKQVFNLQVKYGNYLQKAPKNQSLNPSKSELTALALCCGEWGAAWALQGSWISSCAPSNN